MTRKLVDLDIEKVAAVDAAANKRTWLIIKRKESDDDLEKAMWDTAFINNLPDSSFAVISPGGAKDEEGKTKPRSLRHLPYKDSSGKVDLPHLRNALARLPQTNITPAEKAKARSKLESAARSAGVGEPANKSFGERLFSLLKQKLGLSDDDDIKKAGRKISTNRKKTLTSIKQSLLDAVDTMQQMMDDAEPPFDASKGCNTKKPKFKKGDEIMPITEEVRKDLPQEVQDYLTDIETKLAKSDSDKGGKDDKANADDILKNADPKVVKMIEDIKKENETNKKAADEATEIAKAERDKRIEKEYVAKAKSYENVGKAESVAKQLRAAYDRSEDEGKALEDMFKAAHERIELTKEIGSSMEAVSTDAWEKIEKKAAEMVEKGEAKTIEEAVTKFTTETDEGLKLYAQYEEERTVN